MAAKNDDDYNYYYSDENNRSKTEDLALVEPRDHEFVAHMQRCTVTKIMSEFQEHLIERSNHFLGYPGNLNCKHLVDLSPLLSFLLNNVGDPFKENNFGLHSKKFEVAVLDWFAELWEIENDEYWGYVTNGGTEGNLHGMLLGRDLLPDGILYTSKESHYSIFKGARIYRIECQIIDTLITGEMDCTDLKEKLFLNKDKPAIINLNIGGQLSREVWTILDLVIKTLHECGFSHDRFYIHCDAALYGLVSPFLENGSLFSFKKPIGSVSVSAHKLLGSSIPCGVFISKKMHMTDFSTNIEYIATQDTTISGSRNGHTPIFIWYGLNMRGRIGFQKEVKSCLTNAKYLRDGLKEAGISAMLNESSIVVVFERPLDREFIDFWQLSFLDNMAHVVLMPHVTIKMLDDFLSDLIQKREIWYGSEEVRPICLAEEIGVSNCACSIHGN